MRGKTCKEKKIHENRIRLISNSGKNEENLDEERLLHMKLLTEEIGNRNGDRNRRDDVEVLAGSDDELDLGNEDLAMFLNIDKDSNENDGEGDGRGEGERRRVGEKDEEHEGAGEEYSPVPSKRRASSAQQSCNIIQHFQQVWFLLCGL